LNFISLPQGQGSFLFTFKASRLTDEFNIFHIFRSFNDALTLIFGINVTFRHNGANNGFIVSFDKRIPKGELAK